VTHLRRRVLLVLAALLIASSAGAREKITKITNGDELEDFVQGYYKEPRPELVESAMRVVSTSGLASNPDASAPLLMSFSCIFSLHEKQRETWTASIQGLQEPAKQLLSKAIEHSPAELLAGVPAAPAKNDMNWACFFATGEVRYVDGVLDALQYMDERKDLNLFLTASSAKWSLASIARNDAKVKTHLEEVRDKGAAGMRPIVQDILHEGPGEHQGRNDPGPSGAEEEGGLVTEGLEESRSYFRQLASQRYCSRRYQ
jgi:hypothetical protein